MTITSTCASQRFKTAVLLLWMQIHYNIIAIHNSTSPTSLTLMGMQHSSVPGRKRDALLPWLSAATSSHVTRQENTLPPETLDEGTGLSPVRGTSNSSSGGTRPLVPMKEVPRFKSHLSAATQRERPRRPATRLPGRISASKAPPPCVSSSCSP